MDFLNDLIGNDEKQDYDGFVQRYDRGNPWDDISDDEAQRRYQEVAPRLPATEYEASAEEAFKNLTPEQRAEFGRWLEARGREQGMQPQEFDHSDPRQLAAATTRVRQEQPNILEQLFGGGGGGGSDQGLLANPIAKAALAGIAAMAVRKFIGR